MYLAPNWFASASSSYLRAGGAEEDVREKGEETPLRGIEPFRVPAFEGPVDLESVHGACTTGLV
jgi:hypothetical protein